MNNVNESDYTYKVGDIVKIVEFAGCYYPDNVPDYYDTWMVVSDIRNGASSGAQGPVLLPVVFDEKLHMHRVTSGYDGGIEVPVSYTDDNQEAQVMTVGTKCVSACFVEKTGYRVSLLATDAIPGVSRCAARPSGVVTIVRVEESGIKLIGTAYSPEFAAYMAKMFTDRIAEDGGPGTSGEDTGRTS